MNLADTIKANKSKSEETKKALRLYRKFLATYPTLKEILINLKRKKHTIEITSSTNYNGLYEYKVPYRFWVLINLLIGLIVGYTVAYLIYV